MNIDNPTNSQTVFKTNLLIQALWTVLLLSIAVGVGSYALLMWGETVSQLLTATDKNFWYLSRASGVIAYTLLNLNIWQILLPFGFQTERVGVALGQLGFWLLFICAFSFYVKQYIGQSAWRWLHFLTFFAYMFISIHVFMVGSDSRALPLLLFYAGSQTLVFLLITYRLVVLNHTT